MNKTIIEKLSLKKRIPYIINKIILIGAITIGTINFHNNIVYPNFTKKIYNVFFESELINNNSLESIAGLYLFKQNNSLKFDLSNYNLKNLSNVDILSETLNPNFANTPLYQISNTSISINTNYESEDKKENINTIIELNNSENKQILTINKDINDYIALKTENISYLILSTSTETKNELKSQLEIYILNENNEYNLNDTISTNDTLIFFKTPNPDIFKKYNSKIINFEVMSKDRYNVFNRQELEDRINSLL